MTDQASAERWRKAVHLYAKRINAYVERGDREDWKHNRDEPRHEDLSDLLPQWLQGLRKANQDGETEAFRAAWPTTHLPLIPLLEDNGQGIAAIAAIGRHQTALVRTGAPYEAEGRCYLLTGTSAQALDDLDFFGQCAQKRYLALAAGDRIVVIDALDGLDGPVIAELPRPRGDEDAPAGVRIGLTLDRTSLHRLQPFDAGRRVLAVAGDGVFVADADGVHRLLPTPEDLQERWNDRLEDRDDEDEHESEDDEAETISADLSMVHGAVCPNDRYIACGHQDGQHRIFDATTLALIGEVGPHGEYPHHAAFSADGGHAILNACHFYNGGTIAVASEALPGFNTDFYEEHPALRVIEEGARVYASAVRGDEVFLGDAHGYVRAVNMNGEARWKHFIGSTISAMALSADGNVLFVATYAGFLSMIRMDAGERAPEQIGTGPHREFRRWLFWKQEAAPLAW
jgi:hypothetical protein